MVNLSRLTAAKRNYQVKTLEERLAITGIRNAQGIYVAMHAVLPVCDPTDVPEFVPELADTLPPTLLDVIMSEGSSLRHDNVLAE